MSAIRRTSALAVAVVAALAGCASGAPVASPTPTRPTTTVAPVPFPARLGAPCYHDPTAPRRCGAALSGDPDAPVVTVAEPREGGGEPITTRFATVSSTQVRGGTVRTYRAGHRTLFLVPLGDDDAVSLDVADGARAAVGPAVTRLALGGRAYAVAVPEHGSQRVTAIWRRHRDGTWVSPTGERPRTARFDAVDGALVSWFPRASRLFLSVGSGALGVAAGSPGSLPGTLTGDRPSLLTDGPQAVYSVDLLPADAHDVAVGTHEGHTAAAQPVDGAVVTLVRHDLDPQEGTYGVLPLPAYTDSRGRHADSAVPAIGITRTVWPDVPGAPHPTRW